MDLESSFKFLLSTLTGLKSYKKTSRCEECLFVLNEENSFEIICEHLLFSKDCKNAFKCFMFCFFGHSKNEKNHNKGTNSLIPTKRLDGTFKESKISIILRTDELDHEYLEKYFEKQNRCSKNESYRLFTFKFLDNLNTINSLALDHNVFMKIDSFNTQCVFCNGMWKKGDLGFNHLSSCTTKRLCSNVTNKCIPFRFLYRYRMNQILKNYEDIFLGSKLSYVVGILWDLFKYKKSIFYYLFHEFLVRYLVHTIIVSNLL